MLKLLLALPLLSLFLFSCSSVNKPEEKPNILWIFVDDMNDWMNPYGYDAVPTPAINSLAEEGVLFEKAYVTAPVCSAMRSAMMTGCVQTTFGVHNHRSGRGAFQVLLPTNVKPVPQLFKEYGYLTFNFSKDDYNFKYDRADLYNEDFNRLVLKNKKIKRESSYPYDWFVHLKGKRFFGQLQFKGGKLGGEIGAKYPVQSRVSEDDIKVPSYYPDNKIFRNAVARHYEQVALLDVEVGHVISALKKNGLYENTAIVFFTDHGYQLPRAKQFCYEEGVKVPLIVSWPRGNNYLKLNGKHRADLVSSIDIPAFSLDLAGLPIPGYMEGKNLFSEDFKKREYVVSARDRCDYSIDRIRSIRSDKYRYIRNFKTDRPLLQPQYRDHYASMVNLRELYEKGQLTRVQQWGFEDRVPEELYDMQKDPEQIHNLALNPDYSGVLEDHREYLQEWIKTTGDKGRFDEPEDSLREVFEQWGDKCKNPEFKLFK